MNILLVLHPPGFKILVKVFDLDFNKYKSSNVIIKLGTIFTDSYITVKKQALKFTLYKVAFRFSRF